MGKYHQRRNNLYYPGSASPFRISRSKIELYMQCPRCFYLDRRLGLGRPSMPGWPLNSAVDCLLKNEFDLLRKKGEAHQLMKKYKIKAIPFEHPDLPEWRDDYHQYKGACVLDKNTNLEICGIIDDIWINEEDKLHIVDYKSTSTSREISLEDEYKQAFKRQMEIYQWIFKQKGFPVSKIGYFVYANAGKNRPKFDGRLEFELSIISYQGNDLWVGPTVEKIKQCLESEEIPPADPDCEYCAYRRLIKQEL